MRVEEIQKMSSCYEGGYLIADSWKEDSDKLFGPREALAVWRNLARKGLLPAETESLFFASVSSYTQTHERAIFEADSKFREATSHFLIGDIRNIELPGESSASIDQKHFLTSFKWDAENLPFANESIDVIWDRKGWLWHCAHDNGYPRLFSTILKYHEALTKNGIAVIDAIRKRDGFFPNDADVNKSYRPSECMPNVTYQYESSTVHEIETVDPHFWQSLEDLFEIQDVGRGIHRVRVLKKKPDCA